MLVGWRRLDLRPTGKSFVTISAMQQKFSYFDFIAYVIPGFIFTWAIQEAFRLSRYSTYLGTGNWVSESLGFLIIAFVVGHIIQYRSRIRFEVPLRWRLWSPRVFRDGLMAENYLLKERVVYRQVPLAESRRASFVDLAKKHFDTTDVEAAALENWKQDQKTLENAQKVSHSIYRSALTFVNDKGIGRKAEVANVYYNFFRGLTTASFYSTIVFLASFAIQLAGIWQPDKWNIMLALSRSRDAVLALLFAGVFFYARYVFKHRAINRGFHHVRETLESCFNLLRQESSTPE